MPELSQLTGLSRDRIRRLIALGMPYHARSGTRGESWRFDTSACFRWAVAHVKAAAGDVDGETIDLNAARARLATLQADHQEIKNAALRGELIEIDVAGAELDRAFGAVRAHLLALPTRAAPLVRPDDPAPACRVLTKIVAEVMAELARGDDLPPGGPGGDAA
jgi:phage terminase Nu1 subunit (DNA packaging protein)